MKTKFLSSLHGPVAALALGLIQTSEAATTALPASAASPAGSGTERGLIVRTVQAPEASEIANSFIRAVKQLNGTLRDAAGAAVPNEALAGPNADGSYNVDLINFEKDAAPFDVTALDGSILASFIAPDFFPGIPGANGHATRFATEVTAFLDLPAGEHVMAVSVGTDRTDTNDDDSYQVFAGPNPRDYFAAKVGEFERFAPPFVSNTHNENQFTVSVPVAGVYPFRLVYWQTGQGANLQWYTVIPDTGERLLINDPNDSRAIKAYRKSSDARAGSPYVGEVSPLPGSAANPASAPIEAVLINGARAVNDSSVKMFLNGAQVAPQRSARTGALLALGFDPNPARTSPDNLVRLEFADAAGTTFTNQWSFTIEAASSAANPVSGQWDFDAGTLAATVGAPLQYLDGPAGLTAAGTQFGTTASFGIADIGGAPAKVMHVPGDLDRNIGYIMDHGLPPNGGGTRVNQYTLIMDVFVGETGSGAASLLQISSPSNQDDGDLFWQDNNFGQGGGGYNGTKIFTAGAWHRIAAAYDMAANPPVVTKYVDGIKQDDWTASQSLDNTRRALLPTAVLFGDGDQDERREMYVNSIQIRAGKVPDAQLAALGGPSAAGIPAALPQSNVAGQWDFNNPAFGLSPTVGKPLAYLDGEEGLTKAGTVFDSTANLGVAQINGEDAFVMQVPGDLAREIGYVMDHGIAPNGGGTRVNQYTLIMDVMVADTGSGAAAMLQISSPSNQDDGDLFWQDNNFGQGGGGYNGTGIFTPNEWHRVVAAYDMAANPPVVVKYVDGVFQDNWTASQSLDNTRRALLPTAVLFGDGDQDERRAWWVNSIQIRPGRMSNADIEALGGPSAAGIPVALPSSALPSLTVARDGAGVKVSWPAETAGFVLEGSPTLAPGVWTAVPGVANNSVTVTPAGQAQYFRLKK